MKLGENFWKQILTETAKHRPFIYVPSKQKLDKPLRSCKIKDRAGPHTQAIHNAPIDATRYHMDDQYEIHHQFSHPLLVSRCQKPDCGHLQTHCKSIQRRTFDPKRLAKPNGQTS